MILCLKHIVISSVMMCYKALFSSFNGRQCRFEPTCSDYACQAFHYFSVPKACYLTLKRLLQCHPFGKQWIHDPLPFENDKIIQCQLKKLYNKVDNSE